MSSSLKVDRPESADVRLLTVFVAAGGAQVRIENERVSRCWGQAGVAVTELVTGPGLHSLNEGCRNSGAVTA